MKDLEHDSIDPDLAPLYDAALPHDAPGAWIRQAIEEMARTHDEDTQ